MYDASVGLFSVLLNMFFWKYVKHVLTIHLACSKPQKEAWVILEIPKEMDRMKIYVINCPQLIT